MRKRLVIGAIAAVVIGVVVYALSQPRKGTVEYHKKKYLKACEMGRIEEWITLRAPMALHDLLWRPKQRRIDFHRNALLEAGYLAQREFVVSNRPATDVSDDLYRIRFDVFTDTKLWREQLTWRNGKRPFVNSTCRRRSSALSSSILHS